MAMTVTLPYDPMWRALKWAKEHCPSYITNDLHQDGYYTYDQSKIDYFFASDKEAMMFRLKWQ